MSSKTRSRKTRTTATGTARTLRSVPDQPTTATVRTDTEDKLWAALHANPNSTAAELSAAAKIGKSTAQKILVKWAGDGSVTRTPGIADGGRRAADVWAISEIDTAADDTATATATDGATADERTVDTAPADTTPDEQTTAPTDSDPADNTTEVTPVGETLAESADTEPAAAPAPEDAQDATDATDDAAPETPAPANTEAAKPADGATPDDATQMASEDGGTDGKTERLAPGALRGMVEDHLRDHPGEQFSPTAIAKALGGKSSGAVSNALDKLVADGVAVKTQDKPRRFALAPAEQEAAAAPAN
ncbi:MarR family transcriptional regulator [Prauserella flavalba]|uniref:Uncharacterized protein n=1 Tax=Prauserella flavalba TaxID=1477506 RepID=A0A318LYH8_9PSEU|nr:helix-turn-helix domain-containing protein [Prauserella flavalba]PXY18285.1 hypothetical protein BA062_36215 [Prauserella flavalba]